MEMVLLGLLVLWIIGDYYYQIHQHQVLVERVYQAPRLQPLLRKLKMERLETRLAEYNIANSKDKKKKKPRKPELADISNSEITLSELGISLKGNYSKLPSTYDLLPFRMIYWPIALYRSFYFWIRWLIVFTIQKKPYGPEEREYLTRIALELSQNTWESLITDEQKKEFIARELWRPKNMKLFLLDMRRENSAKFKQEKKKAKRADDYDDFIE